MSGLELRAVGFSRRGRTVLAGIDLAVAPGETLMLLGPSGSGKTTLLRIILGLAAPTTGEVHIGDRVASAGGRDRIAPEDRGVAIVFQDLALWPHLTVAGHLRFALRARRVPRAEWPDRIAEVLDSVGLATLRERRPGELSGGERQRVAIARALVTRPHLLLLDEPLANLDIALRGELRALFRRVLNDRGVTALHVTHDPRDAVALADRIAVLEAGRLSQVGTLAALRERPATPFARALRETLA